MATKSLLFVGAGAVGSYIGAFLARAGHDVTLHRPLAGAGRGHPHARHLGDGAARPVPGQGQGAAHARGASSCDAAVRHRVHRDEDLRHGLGRRTWRSAIVKPEGFVVSAQNCWNDPVVAGIAGADRSVGLVMSRIGVALWKPGEVERGMERGAGAGQRRVPRRASTTARSRRAPRSSRRCCRSIDGARAHRQPLGRALGQAVPRTRWAIPCRR